MAAAEYYNATAAQTAHQHSPYQQSPYQQSPYQQAQELHGSPVPQFNLPHGQQYSLQQGPPPPPYHAVQQDHKPSVHFAQSTPPPQHRPSSGPSSGRPSISSPRPSNHGQYLQPPPHHAPYSQHVALAGPPSAAMQPPHMRPYMNDNQSEYSLGYSSDPEQKRRRKHKHHGRQDEDPIRESRENRPTRYRSRSTNADSFLGAAGGGLIGDLIFPGLGTVGGAVAGWIGGNNYGKHRRDKEDRRGKEQKDWEHKFRDRSNSDDRRHGHRHHEDRGSPSRHGSGY